MTDTEAGAGAAPRTTETEKYAIRCACGGAMYVETPKPSYRPNRAHYREEARWLLDQFWQVHDGEGHEPVDEDGYGWRSESWGRAALSVAPDEARAGAVEAVPDPLVVRIHHGDPDSYARAFNEGWDSALRDAIADIPEGNNDGWTRYDTDDTHVLSVYANGETWDVIAPKEGRAPGGPTPEAVAPDATESGRAQAETWLTTMEEGRIAAIHRAVAPDAIQRPPTCVDCSHVWASHADNGCDTPGCPCTERARGSWGPPDLFPIEEIEPDHFGEGRAEADRAEHPQHFDVIEWGRSATPGEQDER